MQHVLKTDQEVFQASWEEIKGFEIRKNDRNFSAGDHLKLLETVHSGHEMANGSPLKYTGRSIECSVNYVLHGPQYGLEKGWVIMSVSNEEYSEDEDTLDYDAMADQSM